MRLKSFGTFEKRAPGACFSKVPKLFGRISGEIILFVSSKRWRLEARNFAVFLFLFPLQHVNRSALQNKQVVILRMAFRARKVSGLSRNGPLVSLCQLCYKRPCLSSFFTDSVIDDFITVAVTECCPLCDSSCRLLVFWKKVVPTF